MKLKELMEAFAGEAGLPEVAPVDAGTYCLNIDAMPVTFLEMDGRLVIWAEVGPVPSEGREQLYRVLLESPAHGSAFVIDSDADCIFLHRFDALASLSLEEFRVMLETFVNDLEFWRKTVADFREAVPEIVRKAKAAVEEYRNLGLGGFLRV